MEQQSLDVVGHVLNVLSAWVASGALEKIGEASVDSVDDLMGRLWATLTEYAANPSDASALQNYKVNPHNPNTQDSVSHMLRYMFDNNQSVRNIMQKLMLKTLASYPNGNTSHTQTVDGQAGVAVNGDVRGDISHYGDTVQGDKIDGDKVDGDKITKIYDSQSSAFTPINPQNILHIFNHVGTTDEPQPAFREVIIAPIAATLLIKRVLVLQIQPGMPSSDFLRESAYFFMKNHSVCDQNSQQSMQIRECTGMFEESDNFSDGIPTALEKELHTQTVPTIFIFPNASRQQLGWNIGALRQRAVEQGHYVLAAILSRSSMWIVQPGEEYYESPIAQNQPFFRPEYLQAYLHEQIVERQEDLPRILRPKYQSVADAPNSQAIVHKAMQLLQSPVAIDAWLGALSHAGRDTSPETVDDWINSYASTDLRLIIERWYRNSLQRHERLLAICLTLFAGLEEGQILTALKQLNDSSNVLVGMHKGIVDHSDIALLNTFFDFGEGDRLSTPVQIRMSGQQEILLDIALHDTPMNIQHIVPWLVDLFHESDELDAKYSWLYATPEGRSELRRIVGENLSYLCKIAPSWIPQKLAPLMLDKSLDQGPVYLARILAHWAAIDSPDKVAKELDTWRTETNVRQDIRRSFPPKVADRLKLGHIIVLVDRIILLTTGYVWRELTPDRAKPLNALLEHAIMNSSSNMQLAFSKYLLPLLAKYPEHFAAIAPPFLKEKACKTAIDERVAKTYDEKPQDILNLLDRWIEVGVKEAETLETRASGEVLLVAVAEILSTIATKQVAENQARLCQQARTILNAVHERKKRDVVWQVCFDIVQSDGSLLKELFRHITSEDDEVVFAQMIKLFNTYLYAFVVETQSLPQWVQPALLQLVADLRVEIHRLLARTLVESGR